MLYLIAGVVLLAFAAVESNCCAKKAKQLDAEALLMQEKFLEKISDAKGVSLEFLELAGIPTPNTIILHGGGRRLEFPSDKTVSLVVDAKNMEIVWSDEDSGVVNRVHIEFHARLVRPYFFVCLPTFIDKEVRCIRSVSC